MDFERKKDVFTKAEMAKALIKEKIGDVSGDEILTLMCHLNHFWRGRQKEPLLENEMIIYDALRKENLNPMTVYSWILSTRCTDDVRVRYLKGKIEAKQLELCGRNELARKHCREGLEVMKELKVLVEVLLK